jgi:predicted nucleic acid-binding protein
MSLSLLDTNVWVSLVIDRHEHHLLALDWFDKASSDASASAEKRWPVLTEVVPA